VWHLILQKRPDSVDPHTAVEVWGAGSRLGLLPLPGGKLFCYGAVSRRAPQPDSPKTRVAAFLKAFEGFHGYGCEHVLAAVVDGHAGTVDIAFDYPPYVTSATWHSDRTVLLGDAAHAFPHCSAAVYQGQSLAACLGDTTALLRALSASACDVPTGLAAFVGARQQAVDAEQAAAKKVTTESQQSTARGSSIRKWIQSAALSAIGGVGSLGYPALLRSSLKKL